MRSGLANLTILTLLSLSIAGCTNQFIETECRGERIVIALKKYHADHGQYPATLDDLTPHYLLEIPPPTWGLRTWYYSPNATDFQIGVDESQHTGNGDSIWFRYLGDKHGWQTGD